MDGNTESKAASKERPGGPYGKQEPDGLSGNPTTDEFCRKQEPDGLSGNPATDELCRKQESGALCAKHKSEETGIQEETGTQDETGMQTEAIEDLESFSSAMCAAVTRAGGFTVSLETVRKLQNLSYHGMVCRREGGKLGVIINLDALFEEYKAGKTMEQLLEAALSTAQESFAHEPVSITENIEDYENMRGHLRICLVPQKGNEEMLAGVPHRPIADLAAVYRFIFKTEEGEASILVRKEMLQCFSITEDQLAEDALENSLANFPLKLENLGSKLFGEPEETSPLWFVSTNCETHGAGALAYPGTLDTIAAQIGGGYYIIPSSVHEVLAISDSEAPDTGTLDAMIGEVNLNEVSPQERLSDHCYHYDPRCRCFESGSEYAKKRG